MRALAAESVTHLYPLWWVSLHVLVPALQNHARVRFASSLIHSMNSGRVTPPKRLESTCSQTQMVLMVVFVLGCWGQCGNHCRGTGVCNQDQTGSSPSEHALLGRYFSLISSWNHCHYPVNYSEASGDVHLGPRQEQVCIASQGNPYYKSAGVADMCGA